MRGSEPVVESLESLTGELSQVEQEMRGALSDLQAPFSQLVQGHWQAGSPLLCGAFVLTAGAGAPDTPLLLRRRLYLGAAIEVLRLALAVHTRLLGGTDSSAPIDRSVLGSTILAGDFCFSRAAGLAAQTDSPAVVDIFAHALQRVSEGTLRRLFNPVEPAYDVDTELCLSGVAAAGDLADASTQVRASEQQLATLLLAGRSAQAWQQIELPPHLLQSLPPHRARRWQALHAWLQTS